MKKILALILALVMVFALVACGGGGDTEPSKTPETDTPSDTPETDTPDAEGKNITVLVPNADHGWTGAVLKYAEEHATELNGAGPHKITVTTSTDAANQISQVEDLIEGKTADAVVILPYDNQLEATMKKLAESEIPFVMFDRVIDTVAADATSNVKGDNEGIGAATAERFIKNGMKPGDKILIMPGDNSSVPEMRNNGFFAVLKENGWTDEQLADTATIKTTDYTGWSRDKGKTLFTNWLDSSTNEEIAATKWIFTHDDEIAMGILEALKSSDIDAGKKDAFLGAGVHLGTSSGLNEMYSVLQGIHQKDYTAEVAKLADLFSVTYDPGMIKIAIQDIIDFLEGKDVAQDHVVPVEVVDATNVTEYQGFGDAVSK